MTDPELLRLFIADASNAAFTQLVTRHAGLVYAAALRQTHSTALASDITQSAFLDLAKNARRLRPDTHLPSWLIAVTRRTAIDAIRSESRRRTREQTSAELAAVNNHDSTHSPASDLAPILDDALTALSDSDRRAVLLRFFENQSFQQIARHLGASEATAQKRVYRALEKLRTTLARRGIATSATLLAAQLPLHASTTVPATLTTTLAAPAFLSTATSLAATTSASFIQTVFMTATHKTALVSALALTLGGLLYQTHRLSVSERDQSALQSALDQNREQLALLTEKLRAAQNAADTTRQPDVDSADPFALRLQVIHTRIKQLKQRLAASPEESIPEIAFLTENHWIQTATFSDLKDEPGLRKALADLRTDALRIFSTQLHSALRNYLQRHANAMPGQLTDLLPFFEKPIAPAILDRYELAPTGLIKHGSDDPLLIRQKFSTIVDEEHDSLVQISSQDYDTVWVDTLRRELGKSTPEGKERARLEQILDTAIKKYQDAHPDESRDNPTEFNAIFENADDASRVLEMLKIPHKKPPVADTP